MNTWRSGLREVLIATSNSKYTSRTISRCSWRKVHSSTIQRAKSFEEIPGPRPIPVLGNLWRYSPFFGEYSFDKLHSTYFKMHQQYGPLVKEHVFLNRTIVHVFDPEDMRTVLMNEGRRPSRKSHQALGKYRKDRPHIYNTPGLFPSNGEEWYRFRCLFRSIILSPANANAYRNKIEFITDDLLDRIEELLDDKGETDVQPILFNWALECIGQIALNCRLGCLSETANHEAERLVKAAHQIHQAVFVTEINPLWKFIRTPSYSRLVSAQDFLASTVKKHFDLALLVIKMKEKRSTGEDSRKEKLILNSMLELQDADHKDIFTMILDMFLAGIDTTAYITAFGLYNLAINPDVQEKLYEELSFHLPHIDSRHAEKQGDLQYLKNVMRESLRVNPISVGTGRVLPEDLVLSDYVVPKDTMVITHHQVACKLSSHFPEPERFLPDRWKKDHPYFKGLFRTAFSPFGFGLRTCIGRFLAEMEVRMALGKILRKYKITYHHDPIDCRNRLINVPDKPVKLRFELR